MQNPRFFQIDDIVAPLSALHDFSQDYAVIGSRAVVRKMSGRGVQQAVWTKLRTTLNGGGWLPAGLEGLDVLVPHMLLCAAPRALQSTAPAVLLPANRRSDAPEYAPQGLALFADGRHVDTPGVLTGDTLTLTPVAGAVRFQVRYWPALPVFITTLSNRGDLKGNVCGWQIVAEEI